MPLHPQVRALSSGSLVLTPDTLAAARAALSLGTLADAGPGTEIAQVSDVDADGVRVRLYLPNESAVSPIAVYLHGGGWVNGSLNSHDAVCRYLAALSGAAIAAVDYRLAPEHPFPAAFDDIDRAVNCLHDTAHNLNLDPRRMAVVGDSAGGHLAAVTARRWRDRGKPFAAQVLVYPVTDPAAELTDVDSPGLDPASLAFCWDAFAPAGTDRAQPDLSPITAELAGLPPTLVITAEYDVLRGQGEAYADLLAEAGVPTVSVRYQGQIHGFFRKLARFDAARQAVAQVAATLRAELA
ncbi:alpha/beta hydrolase [Actinokineospora sp. NBRC 105648]|uniref:alpha/beta hydrolase n=1 Tax=Actinokineospora sp. NBRC 105648 TaxID=3032206 RepID=UPI00249FF812|nr:alpha/beta hydrolase [Actinokineospora sp. NBRC 105648]GLZ36423.1 alpha/beta hydrolase [Actinokineospora sp. NBRC 105648]